MTRVFAGRGLCRSCSYEEDTDYGAEGSGVLAAVASGSYAPTPQQCCELCGADPACVVAVWHEAGRNHWTGAAEGVCVLKAEGDARGGRVRTSSALIMLTPC